MGYPLVFEQGRAVSPSDPREHETASAADDLSALEGLTRSPEMTQAFLQRVQRDPQLPCNVRHLFGPGLYMREIAAAAGTVLIGRRQRLEHHFIVVSGAVTFFGAEGSRMPVRAKREIRASAGRLVAHVEEDMILLAIYRTGERDMDALEQLIFSDPAPAPLAELGPAVAEMIALSERTDDVCAFPDGVYKCKAGRSRIQGRGLIATANIEADESIAVATFEGKRTPAARYANHARNPNAAFVYGLDGSASLVALKAIAGNRGGLDGEEITVDYRRLPGVLLATRRASIADRRPPSARGELYSRRMQ
jgi:hypothetical protein